MIFVLHCIGGGYHDIIVVIIASIISMILIACEQIHYICLCYSKNITKTGSAAPTAPPATIENNNIIMLMLLNGYVKSIGAVSFDGNNCM